MAGQKGGVLVLRSTLRDQLVDGALARLAPERRLISAKAQTGRSLKESTLS